MRFHQLTYDTLWVGHHQSKRGEEDDVNQVEEQVGKVDPGSELAPLVVEQGGDQGVLQQLTAVVLHLFISM